MKLCEKESLCPLSGVGKPPNEWSACVIQCGLYDVSVGACALLGEWYKHGLLKELQCMNASIDLIEGNTAYL